MQTMLAVSLLGAFKSTWGDVPLNPPGRRLVTDLWIYLLLHRELPLPIGQLLGQFWPDIPEQSARANLRRYLHFLNQTLPELPAGQAWYHRDREHLLWNPHAPLAVDIDAFARAHARAGEQIREGDSRAAVESLKAIAERWSGDLLPDREAPWLDRPRRRHRSQLAWSLDTLARLLLRSSQVDAALPVCRRLLAVAEEREPSRQLLLWLLNVGGHGAEARQLAQDLLDDPASDAIGSGLRGFCHALLNGQSVEAWNPDGSTASAMAPRQAPRETVAGIQGRPPMPGDRFVGQTTALQDLGELIVVARLATLIGSGGVGKTRLAIELAGLLAAEGRWDCCWVDLTAVNEAVNVEREVSAQLGLRASAGIPARDLIISRFADQESLLVLDNCEHVISGAADLVRALLLHCPKLHLIATSRERLDLPGEAVWSVPALQSPTDLSVFPVEKLVTFDAPALFLVRVTEQWPDYAPDTMALQAIVRICRLVEGLPLAIELAAARAGLLDVADIATRLERSFALLRRRDREHPERHQTLELSIDWGYQLLLEDEKLLLARLAVFKGGFTLAAAQDVCARAALPSGEALEASSVEDHLRNLRDKSFLTSLKTHVGRRYQIPEMIRQFGLQRLAERGEAAALSELHAENQVRMVELAEPHLRSTEAPSWLDRLDEERSNLEAAMVWILDHESWGWAYRLAAAAGRYWYLRGHVDYERMWLGKVLKQAEPDVAETITARARYGAGLLAYAQGDFAAATVEWAASAAIYRHLGDEHMVALLVDNLGRVAISLGDLRQAQVNLDEAVAIRRRLGDSAALAASLNLLAEIATRQGDYADGKAHYRSSLEVLRASASEERRTDLDNALCGLANVLLATADFSEARLLLEEALARSRQAKQLVGQAGANYYMGRLLAETGDYDGAMARYAETLALRRKLGFEAGISWVLHSMGEVELRRGHYSVAAVYLNRSLAIKVKLADSWNSAFTQVALSELAALQGGLEEARSQLAEGLRIATSSNNRPLIAQAHRVAALIHLRGGHLDAAAASLSQALQRVVNMAEPRSIAVGLDLAARMAQNLGNLEIVRTCLVLADALRDSIGLPRSFDEQAQRDSASAIVALPQVAAIMSTTAVDLAAASASATSVFDWAAARATCADVIRWLKDLAGDDQGR